VPQFINLIETTPNHSSHSPSLLYILVGYRNKCELISEKYGECLRQFTFNPTHPLCTISSIVDLYDENNQRPELLVTYNCNFLILNLENGLQGHCFLTKNKFPKESILAKKTC
jgi:hypothetical protein